MPIFRKLSCKHWEKESIHRPAPVRNFFKFIGRQNGGHRGKISVVDMVFPGFYRVFVSTTGLERLSLRPEKFSK